MHEKTKLQIGLRIKAVREAKQINKTSFAKSVGVSVKTLDSWEKGKVSENKEHHSNC